MGSNIDPVQSLARLNLHMPAAVSPEQARGAALCVCRNAADADDARRLLDILGLIGEQP